MNRDQLRFSKNPQFNAKISPPMELDVLFFFFLFQRENIASIDLINLSPPLHAVSSKSVLSKRERKKNRLIINQKRPLSHIYLSYIFPQIYSLPESQSLEISR